jgi:hypothetical protein
MKLPNPPIFAAIVFATLVCVNATDPPRASASDEGQEEVVEEKREQMQRLVPVLRPNAAWAQIEVGGGFYDTRREVISPRLNLGLLAGYRFEGLGLLAGVEVDRNWDFTQETQTLTLLNAGVGGEYLYILGNARTSALAGVSILLESTDLDDAGTMGWFLDVRPVSIRWALGPQAAVELTPIGFDLTVPVTGSIPLVLVSFMTRVGFEWSL